MDRASDKKTASQYLYQPIDPFDQRMLQVGDLPYYRRFGFDRLPDVIMPPPTNPDRVLGLPLKDGAWDRVKGMVRKADDCISVG